MNAPVSHIKIARFILHSKQIPLVLCQSIIIGDFIQVGHLQTLFPMVWKTSKLGKINQIGFDSNYQFITRPFHPPSSALWVWKLKSLTKYFLAGPKGQLSNLYFPSLAHSLIPLLPYSLRQIFAMLTWKCHNFWTPWRIFKLQKSKLPKISSGIQILVLDCHHLSPWKIRMTFLVTKQ